MMKKVILVSILLISSFTTFSQYQIGLIPRVSPDKGVFQKIGYTEIEIKYGSPSVQGRQLEGGLIPYGKVWRAGANNATTIEFSSDVIINNKSLGKGKYAFFILPQKNKKWIAIFNKEHKQWGAFNYNSENDALRVEVLPKRKETKTEELQYTIKQFGFQYATILLSWGDLDLEIEVATEYLKEFAAEVESRAVSSPANTQWVVYLQGAEYLEETNSNLELAFKWINQSESLLSDESEWDKRYYPKKYIEGHLLWVKAKLLARSEQYAEAIVYTERLKILSEKPLFYNKKKEEERIDELLELWKNK